MPHWKHEIEAGIKNGVIVCGVDEVGRGPLAGPVVACAVCLPVDMPRKVTRRLKDSKQIEREEREELALILRERVAFGVGQADVEEIDRINILRASHLAMLRAFEGLPSRPAYALVDGNQPPNLPCPITCHVCSSTSAHSGHASTSGPSSTPGKLKAITVSVSSTAITAC